MGVSKPRHSKVVTITDRRAHYLSTSMPLFILLIGVSHPGLCAPVHRIPRGYRVLAPSIRSSIHIELIGALNIDRQYSPFCLISSLDSETFTPRFPLVRAFSFQSFFSSTACVFQGCSPHFHCRKDLLTTSRLLLRGLHYFMSFIKLSYLA